MAELPTHEELLAQCRETVPGMDWSTHSLLLASPICVLGQRGKFHLDVRATVSAYKTIFRVYGTGLEWYFATPRGLKNPPSWGKNLHTTLAIALERVESDIAALQGVCFPRFWKERDE